MMQYLKILLKDNLIAVYAIFTIFKQASACILNLAVLFINRCLESTE